MPCIMEFAKRMAKIELNRSRLTAFLKPSLPFLEVILMLPNLRDSSRPPAKIHSVVQGLGKLNFRKLGMRSMSKPFGIANI